MRIPGRGKCPGGGKHRWENSYIYVDRKGRTHKVVACRKCVKSHDKVIRRRSK